MNILWDNLPIGLEMIGMKAKRKRLSAITIKSMVIFLRIALMTLKGRKNNKRQRLSHKININQGSPKKRLTLLKTWALVI
jgi:hypothetical protein